MEVSAFIAEAISVCGLIILDSIDGKKINSLSTFGILGIIAYCAHYAGIEKTLFLLLPFLLVSLLDIVQEAIKHATS